MHLRGGMFTVQDLKSKQDMQQIIQLILAKQKLIRLTDHCRNRTEETERCDRRRSLIREQQWDEWIWKDMTPQKFMEVIKNYGDCGKWRPKDVHLEGVLLAAMKLQPRMWFQQIPRATFKLSMYKSVLKRCSNVSVPKPKTGIRTPLSFYKWHLSWNVCVCIHTDFFGIECLSNSAFNNLLAAIKPF